MEELKSIPGISSPSPDVALIRAEVDDALYAALNNLNAKQKDILRMRFGLEGERYTLDEVAEKYGVSVERARQVEGKALRLLRESGYAKMLRDGLKQYEQ
jgi:RNA polymerase primary sigma factor